MDSKRAFDTFAPAILQVYHRDKEAFWTAVTGPFLANQVSLLDWLQNIKVDLGLLSAFKGLDDQARQTLNEFGAPFGLDIAKWKSNRVQYFKDAYPVFAFLVIWMEEEGLSELIAQFGEILRAGVYAVAGYGILDENVDGDTASPVEILVAQALIAEYETLVLKIFGVSSVNLTILHQMRSLYLSAEIKEKQMRGKASPYRIEAPEDCGTKGANAVAPYMLSLERLGRAEQIEDYWRVFLLFGAAIQMIDDWQDLEGDLAQGHYSYVTLGTETRYDLKNAKRDPKKIAKLLRADVEHVRLTYQCSKDMIARARAILARLEDRFLGRLVDITELRLDTYFRKEFHIS